MAIYFLTPDYSSPSGGVRVIYRHVDVLNSYGMEAYVLHRKLGHRCDWFKNSTRIVYWDNRLRRRALRKIMTYIDSEAPQYIYTLGGQNDKIKEDDFLVVPEIYGATIPIIAPGIPKVVLNQGCYLTFRGFGLDARKRTSPYRHPDVKGMLINSEDGLRYLNYALPGVCVKRFRLAIDSELFRFEVNKKKQICFTPRKNRNVIEQVINILNERQAFEGFELVPFDGVAQADVAQIMRESMFFLSFGQNEGFGLPPAEAMACGCVVIGYDAGGGKEFFRPEFSIPVGQGDVIGCAMALEQVLNVSRSDPDHVKQMGRLASEFIQRNYSVKHEESDVISFWENLVNQ